MPRLCGGTTRPPRTTTSSSPRWRAPRARSGWWGSPSRRKPVRPFKEIEVDGGDGCVAPVTGNDLQRVLPALAVALHLRKRRSRGASPKSSTYVDFYLSDEVTGPRGVGDGGGLHRLAGGAHRNHRSSWGSAAGLIGRHPRAPGQHVAIGVLQCELRGRSKGQGSRRHGYEER